MCKAGKAKPRQRRGCVVCVLTGCCGQQLLQLCGGVDETVGRIKGAGKTQHGLESDFEHLANLANADDGVVDDITTVFVLKNGITRLQLRDFHLGISLFFLSLRQNF
jgi:hypothetical protein